MFNYNPPATNLKLISFKKPPTRLPRIQKVFARFFDTSDIFHIALGVSGSPAKGQTQKKFDPRPRKTDTSILVSDGAFSISTPESSFTIPSRSAIISTNDVRHVELHESLNFPQTALKISFIFQGGWKPSNSSEHLRIFCVDKYYVGIKRSALKNINGHLSADSFNILDYVRDIVPISLMRHFISGYGSASLPIENPSKYLMVLYAKGRYTQISFEESGNCATILKNGAMSIIPPRSVAILSISQKNNPAAYLSIFLITFTNAGYFPGFLSG